MQNHQAHNSTLYQYSHAAIFQFLFLPFHKVKMSLLNAIHGLFSFSLCCAGHSIHLTSSCMHFLEMRTTLLELALFPIMDVSLVMTHFMIRIVEVIRSSLSKIEGVTAATSCPEKSEESS